MAASEVDIRIRLLNVKKFIADTRAANAGLTGIGAGVKRVGTSMATAGTKMKAAGGAISKGISLPLLAVGVVSAKLAIDFEDQMNQVQTQAGASAGEVKKMSGAIIDMAKSGTSTAGPQELAKGLFFIESAGLRGAKAMDTLRGAEHLATVGRADLADTSRVLAAVMNTGIAGTKNMDMTVGTLNATVGAGMMRMEDLVGAMATGVVPTAAAASTSLQQLGGMIALLTSHGVPARAAAMQLKMAMLQLASPTDKAKAAVERLGFGQMDLSKKLKKDGMIPALHMLRQGLNKIPKGEQLSILTDMFGRKAASSVITMVNHLDQLDDKYKQIGSHSKDFRKDLEGAEQSPAVKLKKALAQLKGVLTELGGKVLPIVVPWISKIAMGISNLSDRFNKLSPGTKKAIGILAGVLIIGGPILLILGSFATAIAAIIALGTGGAIAAGIIALVLALVVLYAKVKLFRQIVNIAFTVFAFYLKSIWWPIVRWVLTAWFNYLKFVVTRIAAVVKFLIPAFRWVVTAIVNTFNWLKGATGAVVGAMSSRFHKMWDPMMSSLRPVIAWVKNAFANIGRWLAGAASKVAGIAAKMWNPIKSFFMAMIEPILSKVRLVITLLDKIGSLAGTAKDLVSKIPTPHFGHLPGTAAGGTVHGSGSWLVGESGPEIATKSAGGGVRVTPLTGSTAGPGLGSMFKGMFDVHVALDGADITRRVEKDVRNAEARK